MGRFEGCVRRGAWVAAMVAAMVAVMVASIGCVEDRPPAAPGVETVKARWDPSAAILPTPTDLVRDDASGRLALPIDEAQPLAEQQWRQWLNTLDGYPTSTSITIPVSGPIDEGSLGGTLVVADEAANQRVPVRAVYSDELGAIVARPVDAAGDPIPWQPAGRYTYGLWGYDSGLRGAAGEPVIADAPFYFARSERSLLDHAGALPGATRAERVAAAEALEQVRVGYAGVYDLLGSFGVPRDAIATAARFSVSSAPTFWFDPDSGNVPVPNALLTDPETGLVDLPIRPDDDPERVHIKQTLSRYDGFSTTGALTFEASAPVDRASALDPANVRLFRFDEGQLIEHTDLERGLLDDGTTLWVRPDLALEPASDYLLVVGRGVRTTEGRAVRAQPIGALLQISAPLVVDGASQISSLADADAARLEPARAQAQPMIAALEARGVGRDDVAMAVPFRTVDAPKFLMGWRAKLYEQQTRTDVVDTLARTPRERGLGLLLPSVETIVTGKLTTLEHLDPVTLKLREDRSHEERLVEFVLTIPESATPGQPIPTVVFGHGLSTSRELLYLIAETLARQGFAAISVDLALHGERSVCLRPTDCKGDASVCNERHECVDPDGTPGELVRVQSPFPDGPSYPTTSGEPFIDVSDIEASRDHFIQAVVDLSQLVRVVRGADWAKASGGYVLDGQDLSYLGMSLGGILGANMTVVEPTIETYVLNVPGAGFYEMIENSAAFSSLYDDELRERMVEKGSDEYFAFQATVRWLLDPVDPVNLVQHAVRTPLDYVDPVDGVEKRLPTKRVLIQMAEGDSVVPNITTRILSERMGIDLREYTPAISNHAFFFDPTSFEGRRARGDMTDFLEAR